MADREYLRLTATRRRGEQFTLVAKRSSLWLGKDHLLSVVTQRFTEEYKRFYFRDIQSILIRTTSRRLWWNVALAALLLLSLAGALLQIMTDLFPWAYWIWMALLSILLIVNNILGTACTAYLQTAVQIEELPSLSRVRRAHKALSRVYPLIVAAQGELAREDISIRLRGPIETEKPAAVQPTPSEYA